MQELSLSIQQRIKKTKQVVENRMDADIIRNLREQQKIRCEKQSFILSMMRSNKVLSLNLKKLYYKQSHQLMKMLEPSIQIKQGKNIDEDFLNEFVHLYTQFFNYFQNKFTFKTKIKNFLRPTNHNLILDLIKYFVDFTRDYYVQTIFWKMKNYSNKVQTPYSQSDIYHMQQISQQLIINKAKPYTPINRNFSQISQSNDNSPSISPRKKTDQVKKGQEFDQKKNNQKIYDILDATLSHLAFTISKENPMHVQSIKMKINQLFRDQKSRNGSIRQINQNYYDQYQKKFYKNQAPSFPIPYLSEYGRKDLINARCQPYKFLLNVQKSGFSVILIQIDNKRNKNSYIGSAKLQNTFNLLSSNNNSPLKNIQSNLSPLKINQRINQGDQLIKNDYFLTSMKVLRVSQNFLPPLITSNCMGGSKNQKQFRNQYSSISQKRGLLPFSIKLKKMTQDMQQAIPFINQLSNSNNVLVRSTSYKNSTASKQKRKLQNYNNEVYNGQYLYTRQSSQNRSKRKQQADQPAYRLSSKKLNLKKKMLGQTRKSYQQSKYGYNSNNNRQKNQQSQQKILQWLQKIKNLKQLQRKKIFGIN